MRRKMPRMHARYARLVPALLCLLLASPGRAQTPPTEPPASTGPTAPAAPAKPPAPVKGSHLLIVSIDGFPFDAFVHHRARLPVLNELATRGTSGPSMTVFPSMTWPSHTTIVTGTMPLRHKVVGNRFLDRKKRRVIHHSTGNYAIQAPALWDLVTGSGREAAAVLWAASQKAPGLTYNIPEVYHQDHFEEGSTPGFLKTLRDAGIPTHKLGKFSKASHFTQDSVARDTAVWLVENKKPPLMLVHFLSVDSMSHSYGPRTNPAMWGMELADRYVGDILKAYERVGLKDKVNVLIVSDHGFFKIEWRLDAAKVLKKAGLIPQLKKVKKNNLRTVNNGHALYVYQLKKDRAELKKAARVLKARKEVERIIWPRSYAKLGLPQSTPRGRMPDFIALARPDTFFGRIKRKPEVVLPSWVPGMHGYLPDHKKNLPVFVAAGPDIKSAHHIVMHNRDVAPTAAHLLKVKFTTPIDGKLRPDLLK